MYIFKIEKKINFNLYLQIALCNQIRLKPPTEESCFIPCLGDCILTQWSEFGPCSHPCRNLDGTPGYRFRTRQIKRFGDKLELNKLCSRIHPIQLKEAQPCNDQECPSFEWKLGSWGSCIIKDKDCGPGVLKRQVSCVKEDGTVVPGKFCKGKLKKRPEVKRSCSIKCPVDCKLSDWTSWSPCSEVCGDGFQYRNRSILAKPKFRGRPCETLVEKRVCMQRDCEDLEWKVGDWGPCKSKLDCGEGIQKRSVTCPAGSESLCLRLASKPKTEEICDNACYGNVFSFA